MAGILIVWGHQLLCSVIYLHIITRPPFPQAAFRPRLCVAELGMQDYSWEAVFFLFHLTLVTLVPFFFFFWFFVCVCVCVCVCVFHFSLYSLISNTFCFVSVWSWTYILLLFKSLYNKSIFIYLNYTMRTLEQHSISHHLNFVGLLLSYGMFKSLQCLKGVHKQSNIF